MVALTIAGTVATFKYVDDQTNNALSSYAKHRFETAADYVTNGAWKKLFRKTNEKLKGASIEEDPNLEFIDDILNKTKLQTDDNIIDLWASLLANALQGKNSVRREYFEVISKLNPYDVLVLNVAFDKKYYIKKGELSRNKMMTKLNIKKYMMHMLSCEFNLNDEIEIILSINNLTKMNLLRENSDIIGFNLSTFGEGLRKSVTV